MLTLRDALDVLQQLLDVALGELEVGIKVVHADEGLGFEVDVLDDCAHFHGLGEVPVVIPHEIPTKCVGLVILHDTRHLGHPHTFFLAVKIEVACVIVSLVTEDNYNIVGTNIVSIIKRHCKNRGIS